MFHYSLTKDPYAFDRINIWKMSIHIFSDHFFTGTGLENFSEGSKQHNFKQKKGPANYFKIPRQSHSDLFKIITNDLLVSSYFTMIKQEAFLEDVSKTGLRPAPGTAGGFDFNKWKTIGTDFLIRGGYRVNGNDISLEIYLYHVPKGNQILGKTYQGTPDSLRKVAHTFTNDAILALTGKRASFDTRVVADGTRGMMPGFGGDIGGFSWMAMSLECVRCAHRCGGVAGGRHRHNRQ